MASIDPFGRTDKLDDGMLEALVVRFEARGKHPVFSKMLREYLHAMNIAATAEVLDLGCGTGLAARAIAHQMGFSGRITGIDLSPYLVAVARPGGRRERRGASGFSSGRTSTRSTSPTAHSTPLLHIRC